MKEGRKRRTEEVYKEKGKEGQLSQQCQNVFRLKLPFLTWTVTAEPQGLGWIQS